MCDYDSKQGETTRFTIDFPRVDIGHPAGWPPGFVPPSTVARSAGTLIGGRPQVRHSWICPGCRRGARSLWFGVPKPSCGGIEDCDTLYTKSNEETHQPISTPASTGATDRPTGEPSWMCWRCLGLLRPSQWKSIATRRVDKAKKLRARLGNADALYSGTPAPPPDMRLSTDPNRGLLEYDELTEELRRCEVESLAFPEAEFLPRQEESEE